MKAKVIRHFRVLLILLLSLMILLTNLTNTYATLIIDPALIKIELKKKRNTGTFILKNTGDEEVRYRAKAVYFTLTSQGAINEIPPDEYSLASWIKFNPQEFVLPPQSSRMVRYSIIPQGKLKAYEYRGAIEFIPLKLGHIQSDDGKGRSFDLKVISLVLVPIYGRVKGVKYSGQLKQLKVNMQDGKLEPIVTILNTGDGNISLNGMCQIINSQGEVVEEISFSKVVIFPKRDRIFKRKIEANLKPDKYLARFSFQSTTREVDIELADEVKFDL